MKTTITSEKVLARVMHEVQKFEIFPERIEERKGSTIRIAYWDVNEDEEAVLIKSVSGKL